jgi:hypothetical protein
MYLHWSPKLAIGLLIAFGVLMAAIWAMGGQAGSVLKAHTTAWILLNYAGLAIWLLVWIGDQARMRGKPVWPWVIPLILAPLPTLTIFILYTLRPAK